MLLTSITEEAVSKGINVLLSTPRTEEDVDSAFRSILKGRRMDGAIIGAEQFGEKQLAELLLKNLPYVMIGRSPYVSTCSVDVDNEAGARMAAEHLLALGHREMAVIVGPEWLPYVGDRIRGFRAALAEKGLEVAKVLHCSYQSEDVIGCAAALLKENPKITAIFAAAGDLVVGTMRGCADVGLSIPRDLSIVAFDDHPFFPYFNPPITTVSQPVVAMGKSAVEMLTDLMEAREPERRSVVLAPSLVVRGSTAPPRAR